MSGAFAMAMHKHLRTVLLENRNRGIREPVFLNSLFLRKARLHGQSGAVGMDGEVACEIAMQSVSIKSNDNLIRSWMKLPGAKEWKWLQLGHLHVTLNSEYNSVVG